MSAAPALELLPGDTVRIGDIEYVMPALNLKGVRRAMELIPKLESQSLDSIDACLEVVHLALRRNYPDLTIEKIEEDANLDQLAHLTATLLAQLTGGSQPPTPPQPDAPPLELAAE